MRGGSQKKLLQNVNHQELGSEDGDLHNRCVMFEVAPEADLIDDNDVVHRLVGPARETVYLGTVI